MQPNSSAPSLLALADCGGCPGAAAALISRASAVARAIQLPVFSPNIYGAPHYPVPAKGVIAGLGAGTWDAALARAQYYADARAYLTSVQGFAPSATIDIDLTLQHLQQAATPALNAGIPTNSGSPTNSGAPVNDGLLSTPTAIYLNSGAGALNGGLPLNAGTMP